MQFHSFPSNVNISFLIRSCVNLFAINASTFSFSALLPQHPSFSSGKLCCCIRACNSESQRWFTLFVVELNVVQWQRRWVQKEKFILTGLNCSYFSLRAIYLISIGHLQSLTCSLLSQFRKNITGHCSSSVTLFCFVLFSRYYC